MRVKGNIFTVIAFIFSSIFALATGSGFGIISTRLSYDNPNIILLSQVALKDHIYIRIVDKYVVNM